MFGFNLRWRLLVTMLFLAVVRAVNNCSHYLLLLTSVCVLQMTAERALIGPLSAENDAVTEPGTTDELRRGEVAHRHMAVKACCLLVCSSCVYVCASDGLCVGMAGVERNAADVRTTLHHQHSGAF